MKQNGAIPKYDAITVHDDFIYHYKQGGPQDQCLIDLLNGYYDLVKAMPTETIESLLPSKEHPGPHTSYFDKCIERHWSLGYGESAFTAAIYSWSIEHPAQAVVRVEGGSERKVFERLLIGYLRYLKGLREECLEHNINADKIQEAIDHITEAILRRNTTDEYRIRIYGNDKQIHEVADFVAAGKTHEDAVGIVFGTPIIGLRVLAFDSWEGAWGCTDRVLIEPRSESQALQILCGLDDTKRIAKEQSYLGRMTAAKWCWNYQKGGFQWYLPSVMELAALFLVRDQANEAMTQLGCDNDCLLPADDSCSYWYWSSLEFSSHHAWYVHFGSGGISTYGKHGSLAVRSVAVLSAPSPSLFSCEARRKNSEISDDERFLLTEGI